MVCLASITNGNNLLGTRATDVGGVSVSLSDVLGLAASPSVTVVRESVWVEAAADKLLIVSLVNGEWSLHGVSGGSNGGQNFSWHGWNGGDIKHLTALASVTVPVGVTVVVGWVDGGAGPEVVEKLGDKGHLARAQVSGAVVIVADLAITGETHLSHVPSHVNIERVSGSVANVAWVGVLAVHSSAPVAPAQEVASVVKLVQDWTGASSENGKVAPATVAPDLSQGHWYVALAWWAVVPNLAGLVVSSDATVGEGVDDRLVDVLWHTVGLGLGGEGFDEASLDLTGVGGEDVLSVEVQELGLGEASELGHTHAIGESGDSESGNEFHTMTGF
jgi:hypothetical protein